MRPFHFGGGALDHRTSQADFYEASVREPVISVLNGFNGCLLCYGQTGSGKTYTMFGPSGVFEQNNSIGPDTGLALRACAELLQATTSMDDVHMSISLQ